MLAKLILSSPLENRITKIAEILTSLNLKKEHPDVLYIEDGQKLGIESARKIKGHFAYKPTQAKGKVVVIEGADNMTVDAQNALLKTIEELPESGQILIGASTQANLLPTILSRCQITTLQLPVLRDKDQPDYTGDIEKLIKSDISERFEYIEKLTDKEEFLQALVSFYYKKLPKNTKFLNQLLDAEKWQAQNVPLRPILEYLMLVIPS